MGWTSRPSVTRRRWRRASAFATDYKSDRCRRGMCRRSFGQNGALSVARAQLWLKRVSRCRWRRCMREVRRRIRTPAGLSCSSRCVAYVLRPPLFGQLAAQLAQLLQRRVVRLKVRDDGLDHADLGIPGTRLSAFHPVAGFPVVGAKLNCLPFLGHKKWEVRLYV
jgi:hypothetical protein